MLECTNNWYQSCKYSIKYFILKIISRAVARTWRNAARLTMSDQKRDAKRKAEANSEAPRSDITPNKKAKVLSFNMKRMRVLTKHEKVLSKYQGIVYWMWRDQRVQGSYCFDVLVDHLILYWLDAACS